MKSTWTTLAAMRESLQKKWQKGIFLREALNPGELFPLCIPLRTPGSTELYSKFSGVREWIKEYLNRDIQDPFHVEWKQVNNRELGKNELPVAVRFQTLTDLARFTGKVNELKRFITLSQQLLTSFPALKTWILKNPFTLLELSVVLEKLLQITQWIVDHPRPHIYLRQLCLEDIDTKFVEKFKKPISEWLDILLEPGDIAHVFSGIKTFEQRYGFLPRPVLIRFRILDNDCRINGISDLTMRADEFAELNMDISTVFVTENDINGLAFPNFKRSILIFGRGYGFESLEGAGWIRDKKVFYWGDIDTHGFAILNQIRKTLPQTESFLMDRTTLMAHKNQWVTEKTPATGDLKNLNKEESALYDDLRFNRLGENIRLEQEVIGFQKLKDSLP